MTEARPVDPATRFFRAPGRVNLIGGQVDYHEGPIVAMAIDREVTVAMTPRSDARVVVRSQARDGQVDVAADGSTLPSLVTPEWGRLVGGVVRALADAGRRPIGATLEVSSTVPIGGGLSSSAAFEVAVAAALACAADFEADLVDLARIAQRGEHLGSGVPCGIQDQMAAAVGGVFLLDCRTLEVETLVLPNNISLIVIDSGVTRTLEASAWSQRREESLAVATALGLRVLRDATLDQVRDQPRGRHAVSEMQRVREFASALRAADIEQLGPLLLASHASSRDDMGVSIGALDVLVESFMACGALGARLTGGGFGGCCVALALRDRADSVGRDTAARYRQITGNTPTLLLPGVGLGVSEIAHG